MKHVINSSLLIYCIVLLTLPHNINAQTNIRTLSPVRIKIELSGKEPRPDGVSAEILFGGGGDYHAFHGPKLTGVYWIFLPKPLNTPADDHHFFPPVDHVACGYTSGPPTGTLTSPGGLQKYLPAEREDAQGEDSGEPPVGCWRFTVNWYYGMDLGLYTLTLAGNEGTLSNTFGMDYGYCRGNTMRPGESLPIEPGKASSWLFIGFPPNENMTMHFYADTGRAAPDNYYISEYVATRTFTADSEGAFMLDVNVTRSAPFAGKGIQYRLQDYGNESDEDGLPSSLHPDNLACSIDYEKAQPRRPIIPLYRDIDNLSERVSALLPDEAGKFVKVDTIANGVPRLRDGKVIVWRHVKPESGLEGWTLEPDLPGVVQ